METIDLAEDAIRQYIDAKQAFTALAQAELKLAEYRGGMIWKTVKNRDYLIRTSARGAQKSLGPRTPEAEAIFQKFTSGKAQVEQLRAGLKQTLDRHRRLNRALRVGRTPDIIIDILNGLQQAGIADKFTVIGTNALYAYETTAGVRIEAGYLATRDFDLLWDNRRKLSLAVQEGPLAQGMLGFLRRMGSGSDNEPSRITTLPEDFWTVKARNADWLLSAPKFSEVIVGTSGRMARMVTVDPRAFALFKLWMAEQTDREYAKRVRDASQARIVVRLIGEYLPQFSFEEIKVFPSSVAGLVTTDNEGPRLA